MKSNKIILMSLILLTIIFAGCGVSKISEVKTSDLIDEEVRLKGTVEGTIKFGELSGYTLIDETGGIFVSSDALPEEGIKKTVSGILKKNLLGYYIQTK